MIAQILFGIKVTFIEYTFLPYLDFSIFNDQVYLEEMNSELGVNLSLNRGLIIDFIFTLIFLVIGIYKFSKKDIKN